MTTLDPAPVLRARRGALEQLDDLRERVAEFLDHPSSDGLRLVSTGAQQFLRFESEEVLPELTAGDFPADRVAVLVDGHDAIAARLNCLSWAAPGTAEIPSEAHRLRHELLCQIDAYNDLRLPRGSLINGS